VYLVEIALRSLAVYVAIVVLLRLGGRRQLGQLTPFDLVALLLVSNAVQNAMVGDDVSVPGGIVSAATLLSVAAVMVHLRARLPWIRRLVEGTGPTVLVQNGAFNERNLARVGLAHDDVLRALREHAEVDDVTHVRLAVLETDGTVSIVPMSADVQQSQTKVTTR